MKHIFDIEIAKQYGINAAILLENIGFWIARSEANEINFYDGSYWTFNSHRALRELFPYMSEKQIRSALDKLINDGLLVTGNYNKATYDRTLWYALTEKGKSILHFVKTDTPQKGKCICPQGQMDSPYRANGIAPEGEPIPDINTDIINNPPIPPKGKNAQPTAIDADFERFWKAYPNKTGKEYARKCFVKVTENVNTLIEAVERQKTWDRWTKEGGKFIPNPSTWLNQKRWEDEPPQEAKPRYM